MWRHACVLGCGLVLAAPAAAASRSGPAGRLVFSADRAPTLTSEIFAVGLDGRRLDLSKSPAKDAGPSVSPDGKLVAFASNRGGGVALYTVHTDGTGLRRVSSFAYRGDNALGVYAQIAWSHDGTRLAAAISGYGNAAALWIGDTAGRGRFVSKAPGLNPAWSPTGNVAYAEPAIAQVNVLSPSGRKLWSVVASPLVAPAWSSSSRLAVESKGIVSVYSSRGHKVGAFRGVLFAWSPNGRELASMYEHRLTVRVGGAGKPVVDAPIGYAQAIQWMSNGTLRVEGGSGWTGYDVAHDRPLRLSPAYASFSYPSVVSSDGSIAYTTNSPPGTSPFQTTLHIGSSSVQAADGCSDDSPFDSLQFVPGRQEVVYDAGCPAPSADIYEMSADGTGLRDITNTPNDETSPAVTPDGSLVAFVHMLVAEKCEGCPTTIWTIGADGSGIQELTPESQTAFDSNPSISPDGRTIVFDRSPLEGASHVVEIPVAGGPATIVATGHDPAWGPARIAYTTGSGIVRTMLPDGTGVRTVARDKWIINWSLAWSRDGRLAWVDSSPSGTLTLVVAGEHHPLPGLLESFRGVGVAWSPDGTRLALTAGDASGANDVWTIDADGTHLKRFTHGLGVNGRLAWIG
jgi:Tol biopolymer transport system component